ncbi:MAG: alpha-2-macroglobulin family protein [Candidatus Cloacimonadaceae bacterium]|nr:alpha-2-macroglobulin family protein [Candidatus Cloacimonadaceae bacterium]
MNSKLMMLILACGLVAFLGAVSKTAFNYESAWKEIDKLQADRLPKSMGVKVDALYRAAVLEDKTDQQIKALTYQLLIHQQVEESSSQKAIEKVKKYLKTAPHPASAILHSMLAQLYWSYYQSSRWRYGMRSETVNFQQDDIATWDLKTIAKETINAYRLSLEQAAELQKHKIGDYPAIINKGGAEEGLLRPTLYDFLAHRALEFYKNSESGLTLPPEEFSITDTKFFQPAAGFARMTITSADTLSLKFQAALLYQELIRFHLNDKDPSALVEMNLDRLEFAFKNFSLTNAEKHYEAALRLEQSKYSGYPVSALAAYKLASFFNSQASLYNPDLSEDYRWHYKSAVEICAWAVDANPKSVGGISCFALSNIIKHPELKLTSEQYVLPGAPVKVLLGLKKLTGIKLKIYRIPHISKLDEYSEEESWRRDDYKKARALSRKAPLWSKSFAFENEEDYRSHTYELALTSLPSGNYIIIAANEKDDNLDAGSVVGYSIFSSTEISYINPARPDGSMLIANRKTGVPISGATIKIYNQEWNRADSKYKYPLIWSGNSNANGRVYFSTDLKYNNIRVVIISGADSLLIYNHYLHAYGDWQSKQQKCLLFTDRSIYRPGQTIYLKGVLYETDGEKHQKLLPNESVNVFFYDVNRQKIASQRLKTNEYGTFNCIFTAPKGVLTGNMSIYAGNTSVSISVEEYKRPRFEVKIDTPVGTYKLDQYVSVKGNALSYAGFAIDNAVVSYRVSRQAKYPFWNWWWGHAPDAPRKEIAHGTALTDSQGEFILTFLATGDGTAMTKYNPYFTFSISVDVTDISGETRSGTLTLNIGEKELILNPVLDAGIDLASKRFSIPIKTTNLGGEPVAAQGTVSISRLQTPEHVQKKRLWKAPDRNYMERSEFLKLFPNDVYANEDNITSWKVLESVYTERFNTATADSLIIRNFGKWKPGAYVLVASASYKQQEIKVTRYFTVYNSTESAIPYPQAFWFVPVKTVCEPGENAKVLIGSGYSDVSVLYEVEKDRGIVDSLRFTLDNSQRLITIPVAEKDRGSFYIHFTYIRDGRLYTHSQEITVPWTNKQISFEYMTFRDKLLPGQREQWRIKLKDHTGGKVTAEVLASMYDASLDAFRDSKWSANVLGKAAKTRGWVNGNFALPVGLRMFNSPRYLDYIPQRNFDAFNWYGYNIGRGGGIHKSAIVAGERADKSVSSTMNIVSLQAGVTDRGEEQKEAKTEDLSGVPARSNFAETAFFYPELRTDETGEISFIFTVPEALTRWKFRALALSKDFKIGTTENSTVTQKPLMVLPNAPRFFREGDRITFSAKITSLDDKDQSGNCQLFLFDAISMAPVDKDFSLTKAQIPFSVKKGESTVLSWDLSIPFGIGAVTYRVVARAGNFSDGEENTLPVLTNRMLVTESLPLPVRGNSTKSFVFEKLKNSTASTTIRNHKLTLEYTSNPAWYAVQALPYLMEYPHDCNEQIFSRFYANSLASQIANANPRIRKVFDAWRDTPNSAALLSNLEKNQELKAVLLQETPWVLDAKNESQSKQRIGLLFDLNNMANQFDSALTKLQKNQSPSGAWPWFPGMNDSWWVTQYIVEGFGHLDHLGVTAIRKDARVWKMTQNAIKYIDRQILADYENIRKYGRLDQDNLGYLEMHYLYARSFFKDIAIPEDVNVAVDYFKAQADEYWNRKDLFGQGLIALALHRFENKVAAGKIIASLKERALHDEEMGMWWKNDNRGWFWYQAPIETQSLLIEAFHDVANDTSSID